MIRLRRFRGFFPGALIGAVMSMALPVQSDAYLSTSPSDGHADKLLLFLGNFESLGQIPVLYFVNVYGAWREFLKGERILERNASRART